MDDLQLRLLDSFMAQGSDGASYKVCAYDRMVPLPGSTDQWESTGQAEYRLEDGRRIEVGKDGAMHVAGSNLVLTAPERVH